MDTFDKNIPSLSHPPNDLKKKSILEQYVFFQKLAKQKWGPKALVFMQVGSFWEVCGRKSTTGNEWIGEDIRSMESLLNYESFKRGDHEATGIPVAVLNKGIQNVVRANYIFVRIDQVEDSADSKDTDKKRRVYNTFYSKATFSDEKINNDNSKFMMQIYIEGFSRIDGIGSKSYIPMVVGLSSIDITTGESNVYEAMSLPTDNNYAIDEICRYLHTYQPLQLSIFTFNLALSKHDLESLLGLHSITAPYNIHIITNNDVQYLEFFHVPYQKTILNKVFNNNKKITKYVEDSNILQHLKLSRMPTATISYTFLLQNVYENNPLMLNKIIPPDIWNSEKYLHLANNAISQLDIIGRDIHTSSMFDNNISNNSLFNIINHTTTAMGSRLLKSRLLNPIIDHNELNYRYQLIESCIPIVKDIESILTNIFDIDRLYRKLQIGTIEPNNLFKLITSVFLTKDLLNHIYIPQIFNTLQQPNISDISVNKVSLISMIDDLYKYITNTIDIKDLSSNIKINEINKNIFVHGYNSTLDVLSDSIKKGNDAINTLLYRYNNIICRSEQTEKLNKITSKMKKNNKLSTTTELKNIENNKLSTTIELKNIENENTAENINVENITNTYIEFDQFYGTFACTQRRFAQLLSLMPEEKDNLIVVFSSNANSKLRFIPKNFDIIIKEINNSTDVLQTTIIDIYHKFLNDVDDKYGHLICCISSYVANVDVYKSCAKTSVKFNYTKPRIILDDTSYVCAKDMRHPIVERISDTKYHPHSILLGKHKPNYKFPNGNGLLIFGLNSSGKSCLMKSLGLNVVMAQAGMFVPCTNFIFSPYKSILTRIISNDNIFKGLSSFAVEMSELSGILARANARSLILGDEICHGTETISAVSLVAGSIMKLISLKSSFIFATHLHQLVSLDEIKSLHNNLTNNNMTNNKTSSDNTHLGIYHIFVEYDEKEHCLKYNRELRQGSGNPIYGIEVAKVLDIDADVINSANVIRRKLLEQDQFIVRMKKSNYNPNLYMDVCHKCQSKLSQETHHVEPQKIADQNGFINHMHKNHISNLQPLCKECHLIFTCSDASSRH